MVRIFLLFTLFLFSFNTLFANTLNANSEYFDKPLYSSNPPQNFREAKKIAKQLFQSHSITFYCGCPYDENGQVDYEACGYVPKKENRTRLEWEHIVPVSELAGHLPCWREPLCCDNGVCYKGRRCCQKIDPDFNKMEADLHNLVPEIGELNRMRSNYRFGVLPHIAPGQFGICQIKIDPKLRRVEPSIAVRGVIARAYLYMAATYGMRISGSQRALYTAWNNQYPPKAWEKIWDQQIKELGGSSNPYIAEYARITKITHIP